MKAPDFKLKDQDNKYRKLADFSGNWIILYFYPKDSTPGCTKEACNFRDGRDLLEAVGAVVIGISKDSVNSHSNFANKHSLDFTLLSDESTEVIKAYGAWGKKKFLGKEYEGIKRNTYLISPDLEIIKTYQNVNPATHFTEVLKDLKILSN